MAPSKYAHLSAPSKEWEEFYAANRSGIPTLLGSKEEMEKQVAVLKHTGKVDNLALIEEGLEVKDHEVSAGDGAKVRCRVCTPTSAAKKDGGWPVLVYFHGGGWALGNVEESDLLCRILCVQTSIVVINVEYRLAPEHPFPAGVNDCWDALRWTLDQAEMLNVDKTRVIIGGASAGGNIAAALTHRARKARMSLHGQILRIPATCHPDCFPPELNLQSLEELKDAPIVNKQSLELFWKLYNPQDIRSVDASPLLAESFEGLPPAYFQVNGGDPLRDEGLAYADKLKEAGVTVRVDTYPGLPHAFNFFADLSATKKNGQDLLAAVKWLVNEQ